MRSSALACLLLLSGLVPWSAPAHAGEQEPVVVPDRDARDALYAWLDEVGYPDGVGAETWLLRDRPPAELAFVLGRTDDDAGTRVFGIDGMRRVVPDDPTTESVDTEPVAIPVDFEVAVGRRLHALERDPPDTGSFHFGWVGALADRTRLVLLARRAHREELPELERRLLAAAARRPGVLEWPRDRSGQPLDALVRRDVELFERIRAWGWEATAADLATRRERLLRFAALFPESEFAERAGADAEILERMIADAPSVPSEEDLEGLSGDTLARALVARLREQTDLGGAMGGVNLHWSGQGSTPLDRLIALGEVALPALLDAYGDPTLTRAVSTGRVGARPRTVTVGDAAYEGVQAITGQWFQTADEARAWLARRDTEGEAALLAEQVFQGSWIDTGAARRVVEIDPAVAASTLRELLRREMTIALRVQLISELANAEHDDVTEILRAETAEGRPFAVRLIAAQQLVRRDGVTARATFIRLWREDPGLGEIHYPAAQAVVVAHQDREYAWERLISELVAMEAWGEIHSLLPEKTPWTRAVMLARIAARAPSPFAGDPVSRMLLHGVSDHSDTPRGAGTDALVNCSDARVSDLIGAELAARDDGTPYHAKAAREDRDVVLGKLRNELRRALGREPRTEPVAQSIVPLTQDDVAPLFEAFDTRDLDALDRAEDAVAGAGLPALRPLRRAFAAMDDGAPGHAAFGRGLTRLASTVRRVIVREGAPERAGAAVSPFAGRPLDVDALVNALRTLLDDGVALTLLVHRPANDTGCTLVVAPPAANQRYRMDLFGSSSQSSHRHLDDDAWERIREDLRAGARRGAESGWACRIRLR